MKLPFNYISQLILVAALDKHNIATKLLLESFSIGGDGENTYIIDYQDYVKSQIEAPVVKLLHNRNISDYFSVYKKHFIESEANDRVFNWFVQDMLYFLVNNKYNIKLSLINGNKPIASYTDVDVDFELNEYRNEYIQDIIKYVVNLDDFCTKSDSYKMVYLLNKEVSKN